MKNKFLTGLVLLVIITAACRKERTCDCREVSTKETTINSNTNTETTTTSTVTTKSNQKKNDFRTSVSCYNTSNSYTESIPQGNVITFDKKTCTLK